MSKNNSANLLASLISKTRKDHREQVASAAPAAIASDGTKFVRRGTIVSNESFPNPSSTNNNLSPSRKRPRDATSTTSTNGISTDEIARQQRILILRKKAAEASAVTLAAKKVQTQIEAQKIATQASAAKELSKATAALSSSSSSSGVSSSSKAAAASEIEPIPREESALELEDGKKAGKNLRRIFKLYLDEWSQELRQRNDSEKRTAIGREKTKLLKECKDNIRPLFKISRTPEKFASDLRIAIRRIAHYIYVGEYVKANDEYIGIAIGNAAWPIGVTMVGIHARAGRQKISSNKIAHAMDDEMTLKYLTSIKRLISFAQRRHPGKPSQMVLM